MFKPQSSLGVMKAHMPGKKYDHLKIAKVINTTDWDVKHKIEVSFEDGNNIKGGITPIWITENNTNIEPKEGDLVVVGFVDGNKNNGLLVSYVMDKFAYANRIKINNQGVKIRWEIGGKDAFIFLKNNGEIEIETENDLKIDAKDIFITCKNLNLNIQGMSVTAPGGSIIFNTVDEEGNGAIATIAGNLTVDTYEEWVVTSGNLP